MPFKKTAAPQKQQDGEQETPRTELPSLRAKIDRPGPKDSNIRAYASVTIGGAYAIHGIKVMNSVKGLFVSMPSTAYKDSNGETKYTENFHAVSSEARNAINSAVADAYNRYISQDQTAGGDYDEAPAENAGQQMA